MASFFIDTDTGQVATLRQLDEAGAGPARRASPALPWFPIQGTRDATTLWYAVMRKPVRDKYIGALCIRHSDHHASLLAEGMAGGSGRGDLALRDVHRRVDRHLVVEVDHVRDPHPDAAVRRG